MAKLAEMLQYFGIFFLISGAAPLSIAVFGSFLVDPSPIELQAFWGEAFHRGQDLYIYQQVLSSQHDSVGCELHAAWQDRLETYLGAIYTDDGFALKMHNGQAAFEARLQTDRDFSVEMYYQYYDWRKSGAYVGEYTSVNPILLGEGGSSTLVGLQECDQVFFEKYGEQARRRRYQSAFWGLAAVTVGLGLCVGGWYLR